MNTKAFINTLLKKTGYQISKADTRINRRRFIQESIIDFGPSGKILELGAGIDKTVRNRFANVVTFDQIKMPGIEVVGDIHELSKYFSKEFDTVICSEVFEHTREPNKAMGEIKKVLKSGGIFIGTGPVTIELHGEDYGHYWNITPQGWELLLKDFVIGKMKLRGTYPNISDVAIKAILQ